MSKKHIVAVARERARGWVLFRYLLPLLTAALILSLFFVPSLQYTNNQSGTDAPLSTFELMKNSWDQVRAYLFGTAQQTNGNIQFSRTILVLLILFWILFFVGVAAALWAMIAYCVYGEKGTEETGRLWFITLIPNRIVLCILNLLILPVALFPRIVILVYRSVYVAVEVKVIGLDPALVGGVLLVATWILSAILAPMEKKYGWDVFRKPREASPVSTETGEERRFEKNVTTDPTSEAEAARRRRAEQIAELLRAKAEHEEKNED